MTKFVTFRDANLVIQCDLIGRYFKVLSHKVSYKSRLFWLFGKPSLLSKTAMTIFCELNENFGLLFISTSSHTAKSDLGRLTNSPRISVSGTDWDWIFSDERCQEFWII